MEPLISTSLESKFLVDVMGEEEARWGCCAGGVGEEREGAFGGSGGLEAGSFAPSLG